MNVPTSLAGELLWHFVPKDAMIKSHQHPQRKFYSHGRATMIVPIQIGPKKNEGKG